MISMRRREVNESANVSRSDHKAAWAHHPRAILEGNLLRKSNMKRWQARDNRQSGYGECYRMKFDDFQKARIVMHDARPNA